MTDPASFSHEALFYSGPRDFADCTAPFVRDGVLAGEPVLVMVTSDKIELLRVALGSNAEHIAFEDMAEVGRNPGRIISAWGDFAGGRLEQGRRLRGVGEPIWAGRHADELVECQHHESLLNLAFADADGFRLQCPYDTAALAPDVIEEARRSHPLVADGKRRHESDDYRGRPVAPAADPLPVPRAPAEELAFNATSLNSVRRLVGLRAHEAGLHGDRTEDLIVAVNEVATNSVLHGGGSGVLRIWREAGSLVCEVRDRGRMREPLVGRRRPEPGALGRHGLWIVNQLCDLVQLRSLRSGTVVRVHMLLPEV